MLPGMARLTAAAVAGLLGWYLYYVRAGGISEVIQVAARNGSYARVLQRLLVDAWRQGAAAVRGRRRIPMRVRAECRVQAAVARDEQADVGPAVSRALASGGLHLVDVRIDGAI